MDNTTTEAQFPSSPGDFDQRINNLLINGYSFQLGEYISKGSDILKNNLGSYIGYLLVTILFSLILGLVPILGSFANWTINSALQAGFFIVAWRIVHNKSYSFGNFFDGFRFIVPLFVLTLMTGLFMLVIAVPYILVALGSEFATIKNIWLSGEEYELNTNMEILSLFFSIFWKLIPLFLTIIFLAVSWSLSSYIVVFARKGSWEALTISSKIVRKNFFSFLAFFIVLGLINIAGAICLLIGLLYTIPLTTCAIFAAYHAIAGTTSEDIAETE